MTIKTIRVKNFKSLKELHVDLGKFNILIGANASGKSNFIRVIEFLRDIERHGLDNAIQLQGGREYLTNLNIGVGESLSVEVVLSEGAGKTGRIIASSKDGTNHLFLDDPEISYSFSIHFRKKGAGFDVLDDRLVFKGLFKTWSRTAEGGERVRRQHDGVGEVVVTRDGETISVKTIPPEGLSLAEYEVMPWLLRGNVPQRSLVLEHAESVTGRPLQGIAIYDFDPKLPKKATPITGKADLEEDGSNLAIVLKNIIENGDQKRKLENLLGDLLPFVAGLEVEKFADKSLLFSLRETYAKKQSLPASLISDGTINITALIAALYFEKKPVAIIEEPERNIHPSLISKLVAMMKDASQGKQIIVTTHNPEVVRHADIGDVLLVSRNGDGFSTISRPSENN
jgi:ABC-type histidine transport system ATPase subunit